MNKKRWISIGVFLLLLVIYVISSMGNYNSGNEESSAVLVDKYLSTDKSEASYTTSIYRKGNGKTLALVKLEGVITGDTNIDIENTYNHQNFLKMIEKVFSKEDVKGVILQVNSPGGGVYESDEIYNHLLQLKARYNKPLVVYMSQQAASGGYYISMAADKIYANRNTLTGSIGVIMSTYNFSQLADKVGIKDVTFKSGTNKDIMNPMRPVTDQEKDIMQGIIDESFGYFVDIVAKGRHMEKNRVLELADGRVYTGLQAKKLGLVDELGNLDTAISGAAGLAGTDNPHVILFENPEPDFLDWLTSVRAPAFNLLGIKQQINEQRSPSLMYLYN